MRLLLALLLVLLVGCAGVWRRLGDGAHSLGDAFEASEENAAAQMTESGRIDYVELALAALTGAGVLGAGAAGVKRMRRRKGGHGG